MALNMRAGLAAVTPLLSQIQQDLGLSGAAAGLLMGIPLAILGIGAFTAPRVLSVLGLDRALTLCAVLIGTGLAVRPISGVPMLFAGTIVFAAGVALANVLVPTAIKRDLNGRIALATAAYTTLLTAAAATGAFVTPYLAATSLVTWRSALALWALPAFLAAGLWALQTRRSHPATGDLSTLTGGLRLLRTPGPRAVILFTGLQALTYYTALTWMPTLYVDSGLTPAQAGALLALATLIGLPTAFIAPLFAMRLHHPGRLAAGASLMGAVGIVLCLVLPANLLAVGAVMIGVGQAAAFPLSLLFVQLRTDTAAHTAQLAGTAQGIGYLISALGPLVVGALYGLTTTWPAPAGLLAGAMVVQGIAGARAGKGTNT
jgi:CP family cyanate transporter-like MFS transporter